MRQALATLCFLLAVPAASARADAPPPIPDGGIAEGSRDIARAWLAEPTERYPSRGTRRRAGGQRAGGRKPGLALSSIHAPER